MFSHHLLLIFKVFFDILILKIIAVCSLNPFYGVYSVSLLDFDSLKKGTEDYKKL